MCYLFHQFTKDIVTITGLVSLVVFSEMLPPLNNGASNPAGVLVPSKFSVAVEFPASVPNLTPIVEPALVNCSTL